MRNLFVVMAVLLCGCAADGGTYDAMVGTNQLSTNQSTFDNTTQIHVEPGLVFDNQSSMKWPLAHVGAWWTSKTPDVVMIEAAIPMKIVNIQSKDGLSFNIDGTVTALSSPDTFTDFREWKGDKRSVKTFPATRELLSKLVTAKRVQVRVITANGTVDGEIFQDTPGNALVGLRKLHDAINK